MNEQTAIIRHEEAPLVLAGQAADRAAASSVFNDYRERKARGTRRVQNNDLNLFAHYLVAAGAGGGDLLTPEAWRGVSWGLVAGFARWLVAEGHAIASINRALSTVKSYAKLAAKAGAITPEAYQLIRTVTGYGRKEGKRLDEAREPSRVGLKRRRPRVSRRCTRAR